MHASHPIQSRIADENTALRSILEGTATTTGGRFFDALVANLARVLNTHSAWVTEYLEDTRQLRALAYWADGKLTRDFLIDIAGTPCETVVLQSGIVHYPDHMIRLFPGNAALKTINAASYLGAPLLDRDGRVIGNLAVMDVRPMPEEPRARTIFQIFAARASAELQRLRAEAQRHETEEKYRRIIQTTDEGFLLMDSEFVVTDVNQAFCRMVAAGREEIVGRSLLQFVDEDYRQFLMMNRENLFAGDFTELEGSLITLNRHKIPVLIHGNRLRDNRGTVIDSMLFVTDLTLQKRSIALAAEVQRSLLPEEAPYIEGLEVAGRTLSCDEIGGDYFDFVWDQQCPRDSFSMVVGDVTGHGVEAALLMTTVRAFLRMRASQCGGGSQIVTEMNRHLARDVSNSGRFMTLSFIRFDVASRSLRWVRAGHPPALVYDPVADRFTELRGQGLPLGVDDQYQYEEFVETNIGAGQIIAIGTDGIWEASDRQRNYYGIERFREVIRQNATLGAKGILEAVFTDVKIFTLGARQEDDITLVVAKVGESQKPGPEYVI
ncbi:MAG: SpoIIE family protein phosphatase [Deltaproteobacteria bacterium]|nr:SpoIIE family protein phosphatase [Deltaproteobacteria bacterium]